MSIQTTLWSGVGVSMQSALGTAKTITGITKAAPGVVSSPAHGNTNGTYIILSIQGMYQLDGKVFRVCNVATDSYQLEDISGGTGISTISYDTFSSGSAQSITFGTSITSIADLSSSGGDFELIDNTTIHVNEKSNVPGPSNPIQYSLGNIWDISDQGQIAMKAASDSRSPRVVKFVFSNGRIMVFNSVIGFSGVPTGSAQSRVDTPAIFTIAKFPSFYSA